MAWGATRLPWPVLLVLLASASWAQETEFVSALEGEAVSVSCRYQRSQPWQVKSCCRQTRLGTCDIVVDSSRTVARQPRFSIRDNGSSGVFTVTMTKLRVKDSGTYWCGIYRPYEISVLKVIRLVVSRASTLPTTVSTRSTRRVTVLASATSPVTDSPPDNQKFITLDVAVAVAVLLLLVLTLALILVLYLRKARGRAGKDADDSHHIYDDLSVQKEETTDFAQQMVSGEDTGNICYASLIHLNHSSPEDSIYANTLPNLKPVPDPILSVEYASIAKSGPQSSKSATLEEGPGN
ncbi:trem-like transcript 4 protein [Lemur catta]|uniref:trem-like transcript 4 protein n=1 Tax=Lemur catta TaxID=9447 RepID=UPI001E26B865|nr:trem-like transcript 4 protein [Lemur catta]